jgi:outer membrane murein-binding lipoprotein Lpp
MEEQMSEIQTYVEKLEIKKAVVGGFDKEAVYTSMQELSSMYQKEMIQLKAENERLEAEYKAAADELEQANKDIQLLKFQLAEERKSQNKYNLRFNTLNQAIDAISAGKEKVIEESKRTAQGIVSEANEKLERISKECLIQKQQKDLILSKITDVKQQFSISIENIHSILTKLLLEVDVLQKSGLEQAFHMDEVDDETEQDESQSELEDETDRLVRMIMGSVSEHDSR